MNLVKRTSTTPELIADTLRSEIREGTLAPGGVLRQEDIAARFEVSRIPAREALLKLQSEGLVVVYPNRGAFVAELSRSEIEEIYELRVLLECDVLAQAVPRMTGADFKSVRAVMLMAEETGDGPDWINLDWQFHRALYAPSGRVRQIGIIETLRNTVDRYWTAYAKLTQRTSDWLNDHEQVATACSKGQVDKAVGLLRRHLLQARDLVLKQLPSN